MEMTHEIENAADTYDDWVLDFIGRKHYAEEIKKAKLEGEREGELESTRKIVLNMLRMKYPLDEISKITLMSKSEIRQLANENNLALS